MYLDFALRALAAGRYLEPAETGNGEYYYLTRVLKRRAKLPHQKRKPVLSTVEYTSMYYLGSIYGHKSYTERD